MLCDAPHLPSSNFLPVTKPCYNRLGASENIAHEFNMVVFLGTRGLVNANGINLEGSTFVLEAEMLKSV